MERTLCADIAPDGRLLTAGRNHTLLRLISATGKPLTVIKNFTELPNAAVLLSSGASWVVMRTTAERTSGLMATAGSFAYTVVNHLRQRK